MAEQSVSERLAEFVVGTTLGSVPAAVVHDAKRSLVNYFAGAIGVSRYPETEAMMRVIGPLAGPATATVFGRTERLDCLSATFVNAVTANLLDYDDTHLRTVIHPSAPVAPAVFALAESLGLTGADALLAFALGCEVECRVGNSVSPQHYARGWHITASCGIFGAAAAAAKLLGLSPSHTAHALGIAASQASGIVENLPHGAKNVGVGNAARNGIFAARWAEQGFTGAPSALEGPLGWAAACGDVLQEAVLFQGLGAQWELSKNTFKPYPCGIVMHSVIDACLELRARHGLTDELIDEVVVKGDALLLARGDRSVAGARDAKVSIHHCAAAPLLWGQAGVDEFSDGRVLGAEATAMRARVRAELDASHAVGAATVVVQTTDGRRLETTVEHPRGSIEQPLSDGELEDKMRALVSLSGSGVEAAPLLESLWALESTATVSALVAQAAGR